MGNPQSSGLKTTMFISVREIATCLSYRFETVETFEKIETLETVETVKHPVTECRGNNW